MVVRLMQGDALQKLDELEQKSVDCVFTSPDPPFHNEVGIGALKTFKEYYQGLVAIFDKMSRVLKDTGTFFLQMGSYHDGYDLILSPYIVASMLVTEGWILRSDLIWHRPDSTLQEDFTRFKRDCEHVFFFTKYTKYYFNPIYSNTSLIASPYIEPRPGQWLSGFPRDVIERCLRSGCPPKGTVLDPFVGTGMTGVVALEMGLNFIGIELEEWKIPKIMKELKSK